MLTLTPEQGWGHSCGVSCKDSDPEGLPDTVGKEGCAPACQALQGLVRALSVCVGGKGEGQGAGAAGPVDGRCILQTEDRMHWNLGRRVEENEPKPT